MGTLDDSLRLVAASRAHYTNIKLVGVVLLEGDVYAVLGDERLARFHRRLVAVAQHLKAQFGLANEGSEGDGDGQPHHARARNAHAHGVFQDVRAQPQLDMLGAHAQQLRCLRHTEGYGHRFGAADGGNHLLSDELQDRVFLFNGHCCRFFRFSGQSYEYYFILHSSGTMFFDGKVGE